MDSIDIMNSSDLVVQQKPILKQSVAKDEHTIQFTNNELNNYINSQIESS